jgi:hypothetical protein
VLYCNKNDFWKIAPLEFLRMHISGLVGNTLVIYVVLRFSKMHTVTNLYILNLAIADECFLVGIPFLIVTIAMGSWPFGAIMCKIYYTTTSINQISSSIFLFVLAGKCFISSDGN